MTWNLDTTHSSLTFGVKHMVFSTFRGRFDRFEVDLKLDEEQPENSTATVRIDPTSFRTGVERLDTHLQGPEFFDTARFPGMSYQVNVIKRLDGARVRISGLLTLKGKNREVVLEGELHGPATDSFGGTRAGLSAAGDIDRRDFEMTWNLPFGEGGVYLGNTVHIQADIEFVKAEA